VENGNGVREPSALAESASLNKISKSNLRWILFGLWSAGGTKERMCEIDRSLTPFLLFPLFLGSLDGTIVATLLTPIGSYFNKSHQSSYIGSVYLLSACCFTPLYGRLSDVFGRKGAMILAYGLFGSPTALRFVRKCDYSL
jgi:hypothetical protein